MRPRMMSRVLVVLIASLALASCSTTGPATAPAVASPACLAVKAYTPDQLQTLAANVRALPPGSPLRGLVVDYARLRDQARASCGAGR